jgi:hypothetical protein
MAADSPAMPPKFAAPPSQHLTCVICTELFSKPVRIPCGHTFCEACIKEWVGMAARGEKKGCPQCRTPFPGMKASHRDLLAANIIDDLEIMCNVRGVHCSWRGRLSERATHEKGCRARRALVPTWLQHQAAGGGRGAGAAGAGSAAAAGAGLGCDARSKTGKRSALIVIDDDADDVGQENAGVSTAPAVEISDDDDDDVEEAVRPQSLRERLWARVQTDGARAQQLNAFMTSFVNSGGGGGEPEAS